MKKLIALLTTAALLTVLSSAFAQMAPTVDVRNQTLERGTISAYLADNANVTYAQVASDSTCYDRASDMNSEYNCLYQALSETGLLDTLAGSGPFTVFAPTDHAFQMLAEQMGPTDWNALFTDPAALAPILTYHVLPMALTLENLYLAADGISGTATETTVQGSTVGVNFYNKIQNLNPTTVTVGASETGSDLNYRSDVAYAIGATVRLDNGTIIPISYVLTPSGN